MVVLMLTFIDIFNLLFRSSIAIASFELLLINMIPSLVNSYDIFMVTASAVILNTIELFYHVNYIRKALCCQVACPCPLNLLCPMLMPGWS